MENLNSYQLSRKWFDFCFENPEKIKPNHTSLYFFCVEHCNRLGWKQKFGLPTTMAKEAIGIKSYNTYINTLNDLVFWGFIKMIEKSKNQYSSNIIALSNFNKALDKALDKALINHTSKQRESTQQSIDSIIKQLNKEQLTIKQLNQLEDIIKKNKSSCDSEIVFPFNSENFISSWKIWKEYKKKEHNFKYKSEISEQASLNRLQNMSNNNESIALNIMKQSIENGWKGFVEISQQKGSQISNSYKQKLLDDINGA